MDKSTTSARTHEPTAVRPGGATRTTVRVLGGLAALTGIEHGIGEVTQGAAPTPALVFESWPHVEAFEQLDGEPAMSLVPHLLVSGVLSVVVAVLLGLAAISSERPRRGATMIGLSLLLLLVGGGFGPPLLGVLAGVLALGSETSASRRPGQVARVAARAYPWPLVAAVVCFVGLVPGTVILRGVVDRDLSALVAVLTLGAFVSTASAMWSARARDQVVAWAQGAPAP